MRSFFGALIGCALLWLIYTLFGQAHAAYGADVIDTGRAILVFGKIVVASLLLASDRNSRAQQLLRVAAHARFG